MKRHITFSVKPDASTEERKANVINACCAIIKQLSIEELAIFFDITKNQDRLMDPAMPVDVYDVSIDPIEFIEKYFAQSDKAAAKQTINYPKQHDLGNLYHRMGVKPPKE